LVPLKEIGQEEVDILKAGIDSTYNDPAEVREALLNGTAVMWRVKGPETDVVMVTQERPYMGKPGLFIWIVCGKGARQGMARVREVFWEICRLRGLNRVWAKVHPKAYDLIAEPLEAEINEYVVSKEAPHNG
jgi:hypothetical protein